MILRMYSLSAVLLLCLMTGEAIALPRFSSRTGMRCQSCHVNPTGAGLRQEFGAEYGREKLPITEWAKAFETEDAPNPLVNIVGLGADFRTLFFYSQLPGGSSTNSFSQMQGDLYLNFKVARKISLYVNKGLTKGFEAFGLLNILPSKGWIKAGKFVPNFGTRVDDHTAFVRRETGFTPEDPNNRYERTGAEIGISPGPFSLSAGIYNSVYDDFASSAKSYLGRAEGLFQLDDDVHFGVGGDIYSTKTPAGLDRLMFGGMSSLSIDQFTLMGEADFVKTKMPEGQVTGFVTTVEADYPVVQGVDLKIGYDFFDPDTHVKNGSTSRYSFGVEVFLMQGVEIRPVYRLVQDTPIEQKNDEFHLLLHIYI